LSEEPIYCGPVCSQQSRVKRHRASNQVYQKTIKGRRKHAERQKRYRQRQKEKVTDHGSPDLASNDLLHGDPSQGVTGQKKLNSCYFCGNSVLSSVRVDYLRYKQLRQPSSWPLGP